MAEDLLKSGPVKLEDSPRRIRALLYGKFIFDSTNTKLVWEHPYYPSYYLPRDALQNAELAHEAVSKPGYTVFDIAVGSEVKHRAAVLFNEGPLSGFVRLDAGAMDGWFEEDDPIFVHPNDPYKRIDIRQSSRKIAVEVDGVLVAASSWSKHLYETGLPVRYYLPHTSVNFELLKESETRSWCPYKGHAKYFDVVIDGKVKKDLVWWYQTSPPDTAAMQNLVSRKSASDGVADCASFASITRKWTFI